MVYKKNSSQDYFLPFRRWVIGVVMQTAWFLVGAVFWPASTMALAPGDCHDNNATAPCLVQAYINPLIALLSAFVGVAAVVGIIWGAILYTQSGGDPAQAAAGKKKITNALIGLIAFIFLYAFLQFILT